MNFYELQTISINLKTKNNSDQGNLTSQFVIAESFFSMYNSNNFVLNIFYMYAINLKINGTVTTW